VRKVLQAKGAAHAKALSGEQTWHVWGAGRSSMCLHVCNKHQGEEERWKRRADGDDHRGPVDCVEETRFCSKLLFIEHL
jgi:hypothetical protein